MLRGRVSSRGAGIPAAIVTIEVADVHGVDQRPRLAITDADGAWTLDVAPDKYIVTASADGFLPVVRDVDVAAGDHERVDIELVRGGTRVHGIVKDIGGGSIAGAHVSARSSDGYFGHGQISTISRADGTYALTLPSGSFHVEAAHDAYVSDTEAVDVADEPVALEFALIPAGTMLGEVIARDTGKPVPGAIVYASGRRDVSSHTVVADEQGAFAIDRLHGGLVDVTVRGGGYCAIDPVEVEVPMGHQIGGVRIVVDRAYVIRGRVVDKQHPDRAVAHARIMLQTGERLFAPPPMAQTGNDGTFDLESVSRGEYLLEAYGDGLESARQQVSVRDRDLDVTVPAITYPMIVVTGRVVPPARAKVALGSEDALADDHGEFKIEHVRRGKQTLFASTTDGRGGEVELDVGDRDVSGVEVHLAPLASISGRVVDTRGTAMEGFHVEAYSKAQIAIGRPRATSRADGSFRLLGVEPGAVRVLASSGNEISVANGLRSTKVDVAAGAQVTGVTIVVDPRDGVVRGKVVSADGSPVPDAWVTAGSRGDLEQHAFTAADGTFTLEHLRPHPYEIVAEDPRGARRGTATDVEPGATVTITVAPFATLTVHVNATAYRVGCVGPGMFERDVTSPTGEVTCDHCIPGKYSCTASNDAGVAAGEVIVANAPARLDLALEPWPTLSGTVVDAAGTPQAGIVVGVPQEPTPLAVPERVTDAHGRFELDRVVPGHGAVVLRDSHDRFMGVREFTLTGSHLDLGDIQLRPPRE